MCVPQDKYNNNVNNKEEEKKKINGWIRSFTHKLQYMFIIKMRTRHLNILQVSK